MFYTSNALWVLRINESNLTTLRSHLERKNSSASACAVKLDFVRPGSAIVTVILVPVKLVERPCVSSSLEADFLETEICPWHKNRFQRAEKFHEWGRVCLTNEEQNPAVDHKRKALTDGRTESFKPCIWLVSNTSSNYDWNVSSGTHRMIFFLYSLWVACRRDGGGVLE